MPYIYTDINTNSTFKELMIEIIITIIVIIFIFLYCYSKEQGWRETTADDINIRMCTCFFIFVLLVLYAIFNLGLTAPDDTTYVFFYVPMW